MSITPQTLVAFIEEVQGLLKSASASNELISKCLGLFLSKEYLNIVGDVAFPSTFTITMEKGTCIYPLPKNYNAIDDVRDTETKCGLQLRKYYTINQYSDFFRSKNMTDKGTPTDCFIYADRLQFYPTPSEKKTYELKSIMSTIEYYQDMSEAIYGSIPPQFIDICIFATTLEVGVRLRMPEETLFYLRDKLDRSKRSIRQKMFDCNRSSGPRASV